VRATCRNGANYGTGQRLEQLCRLRVQGRRPTHPDWYHNLLTHPQVSAEIGAQTVPLVARVAEGAERDSIWDRQKREHPGFADYETKTARQIPVIVLDPAPR